MARRRTSLTMRIVLLSAGLVLLTALVAGVLGTTIIQRANEQAARRSLAALADTAQATVALAADPDVGQARARKALADVQAQIAVVRQRAGEPPTLAGDALPRRIVTAEQLAALMAGRELSVRQEVDGGVVLLEGRPTAAGGIVLAQRRSDAVAVSDSALVALAWSLAGVVAVALVLAVVLGRRVARPLRRTAAAANALAQGRRDVAVPESGPAEVAEVAGSVNTLAAGLAHSEARQREFLLSVSHDLRTPLTTIHGYAESLEQGVIPPERVADVGRVLGSESARLERLVGDLLDLARLDAHQMRLDVVDLDVGDLLDAADQVWRRRCAEAGVIWTLERPAAALPVRADPGRLRQALDGLVENALRVTPQGRPVVLAARPDDGYAVIEVRDGGPGLTDDDLGVAFDQGALYERYRGVRAVGTGLGLAIVGRIVQRHGGSVGAGHAPEGGACFQMRLPLAG